MSENDLLILVAAIAIVSIVVSAYGAYLWGKYR